jgi:hypothetical protein
MRRTNKRKLNLNRSSQEYDLKKSPTGCAPCLKEALKIDRKINGRSLNEIKINEIKSIVRSIFKN